MNEPRAPGASHPGASGSTDPGIPGSGARDPGTPGSPDLRSLHPGSPDFSSGFSSSDSGDPGHGENQDEFFSFLDDVSQELATVVEAAPWRRRIAEAILRWEGEGIRTSRLEEALHADTPPDLDNLLTAFYRDAERLLVIRRELAALGILTRFDDPSMLPEAEARLAARNAQPGVGHTSASDIENLRVDNWFLNPGKLVLNWVDIEERLVTEAV
ncbi:MAG: hypothetical protein LBG44_06895 [Gemmatimonadota bacterium]|jgi:hypothetical protein|nr:hypothetical protein [Gemmatimonadota bacterium]